MTLPNVPYQLYVAGNGRQVVSTQGVAVQLSTTDTPCFEVFIDALSTNTAWLAIGTSTANSSTGASRSGTPVAASASIKVPARNLNAIWMDGVSTEGCSYSYTLPSVG